MSFAREFRRSLAFMDKNVLVSVGVASYNNSSYILETLNSIKEQTHSNIELIIVDDCSTDNSTTLIENWIRHYEIKCEFIKNSTNLGVSQVCNRILYSATGKYLSIIASDDVMVPDKIRSQVCEFENLAGDYAMVYGDTMKINGENIILENSLFRARFGDSWNLISGDIFKDVVEDFFFYTQSSLIRIESLKKLNFRFNGKFISEDWYMQLRLSQEFKIHGLPMIASKYRILPTSMGARFWNVEKQHIVLYSQFLMFNKLFSFEKRNSDRWNILVKKLKFLFFHMKHAKNSSKFKIYKMGAIIFMRTGQLSELKDAFQYGFGSRAKAILKTVFYKNK